MADTLQQFDQVTGMARSLFLKKTSDYGTAWRILRTSSLTDQIYIKARRIRSIEEKGSAKIDEPINDEYIGIINYCIMALIQMDLVDSEDLELASEKVAELYDLKLQNAKSLLANKNHDYGEAWRDMRTSSITDLILMKLLRIKQIENNKGETIVSEGIDAGYLDIINYAVFALIHLSEK